MANLAWRVSTQATLFLKASDRCFEERYLSPTTFEMLLQPAVVCRAFSIELNFKALIISEGGEPKSTHNLSKLFKALRGSSQNEIIKKCQLPKKDFMASLEVIEKMFEEWRYVYELGAFSIDISFFNKLSVVVDIMASEKISR